MEQSLLELAKKAPFLCGAKYPAQYARIMELVWEDEKTNITSVFARSKDLKARLRPATAWSVPIWFWLKKKYILDLAKYAYLMHHAKAHQDLMASEKALNLKKSLLKREEKYPDVKEIYSVEAASVGIWA